MQDFSFTTNQPFLELFNCTLSLWKSHLQGVKLEDSYMTLTQWTWHAWCYWLVTWLSQSSLTNPDSLLLSSLGAVIMMHWCQHSVAQQIILVDSPFLGHEQLLVMFVVQLEWPLNATYLLHFDHVGGKSKSKILTVY